MDNENKACNNCRYARQHYVIGCRGHFVKLENVMDCMHNKVTKIQFKKCFKNKSLCEHWEPFELKQQEHDHKINELLKLVNTRLVQVIEVLESREIDK